MKAKAVIALCAASLLVGAAVGYFASRGGLDAELRKAIEEKGRLMAELTAAASAVRESGAKLESIREKMDKATSETDEVSFEIATKATTIEGLVNSLKTYVRDARSRLRELTEAIGKAVDANKAQSDRIDGIIETARDPEKPR